MGVICLNEHQNELEKLQKAALLIEEMSMGRLKVCPSTVGHVYIRPESDAYIGLQMKYLKNAVHSMKELPVSLRAALSNRSGEGYVDTAVKILMAVVIGALVLAGLYALFDDTVMPTLTRRIQEMFNYAG